MTRSIIVGEIKAAGIGIKLGKIAVPDSVQPKDLKIATSQSAPDLVARTFFIMERFRKLKKAQTGSS